MPTQNDVEKKIDFLVQDAKDAKAEVDEYLKKENAAKLFAFAIIGILLLLMAGMIGYTIGYKAGIAEVTQQLILQKMGILL